MMRGDKSKIQTIRFYASIVLFAVVGLSLAGCGRLLAPVKARTVSHFSLSATPSIPHMASKPTMGSLLVTMPTASAGYQTTSMVYVEKPYQLSAFAKHSWVAPPAEMLLPLLVTTLRKTGLFEAIVAGPFAGTTTYTLTTHLETLQQSFLKHPSELELKLSLVLFDNRSKTIVSSRTFTQKVQAGEDPYQGVVAANAAVSKILKEFCRELV